MKRVFYAMTMAVTMLAAAGLSGCYTTGTPAQQEAARIKRGKNVAKLEKRAWSLGGFLVDLAANVVVNSATNYVTERYGGGGASLPARSSGFRK